MKKSKKYRTELLEKLEEVQNSMKHKFRRRSTELNEIKYSKKYRTQSNKKTRRRCTDLNKMKNSKKQYRTQLNEKLEEVQN